MDLLAGAAFASCAVYVLLAVYFFILAGSRIRDAREEATEYAFFAAACVAMGAYAFCNAVHAHTADPVLSATWGHRAFYFAPLGAALILAVTSVYAELSPRRRIVVQTFGFGGALAVIVANATGLLHQPRILSRPLGLGWVAYVNHGYAPTRALEAAQLYILVSLVILVSLLVRAYLRGKREALLACLGAFVIAACTVNDVLVQDGVHRGIFLSEYGFTAFAFGLSYTLLARHVRVSEELAERGAELRKRGRQLRRAYEELRAAQEELVRKEQLAVVGEIAAVVSHEVRNPLAIIANAVAGLRRAGTSAEDRDTLLSILDEETERLNRLVGDLLRYARPLTIERRQLDCDALLARALDLSRNYATVRLELEERPADVVLPAVYGDPDLLRQVLDNLVQNACQAMSSGGTLSARVRAADDDGVQGLAIEIADTGEGMDTQVRSRARTPFFTTRPGGTGLGLAICDRIATAHGGYLSIKSRSGEGTIVTVFLPAGRRSESNVVLGSSAPPPPSKSLFHTPPLGMPVPGRPRARGEKD